MVPLPLPGQGTEAGRLLFSGFTMEQKRETSGMNKLIGTTLLMAGLIGFTGSSAIGEEKDKPGGKTPEQVNEEIIENSEKAADGTVQAETGRAKPVENWFGCKPGNDKPECEAKPNPAAAAADEPKKSAN